MSRSRWIEDNKGKIDPRNGKLKGGLRYRARYRTLDQKVRSKRFATKVEAERWLDLQLASITKGDWVDPNEGKVSFANYAAEVQASRVHLAATTKARDEAYMRRMVLPHLGELPLASIRPTHLRRLVAKLIAEGKAPATVRKAYQLATMVLSQAVLDDKSSGQPFTQSAADTGSEPVDSRPPPALSTKSPSCQMPALTATEVRPWLSDPHWT
ncbi:MAG: hypothetical protein U9N56_08645 [Actinomycetota bacterium]|nr:hypothetical protein [Actinomycetota bacterium]